MLLTKTFRFSKLLLVFAVFLLLFLQVVSFWTPPAQAVFGTEDIFFECGAETGNLVPPWDRVGPFGSDDASGSYTIIDDAHARTGNYSMKLYQPSPPKSDAERRISNRYYQSSGSNQKDFYISWWVYFDDRWLATDVDGWGTTLGGWQIFYGPPTNPTLWWTGGRFFVNRNSETNPNIWFSFGVHIQSEYEDEWADYLALEQIWKTNYLITDYLNQWVHFQVYINFTTDNSGAVRAWFNNNLVANKTGIKTSPEGYSAWDYYDTEWASDGWEYPWIVIELYQSETSFESWIWVDDVVAATEKVPENYGMINN